MAEGIGREHEQACPHYLPSDTIILATSDREMASLCDRLNATPRKCLGFRTPAEAFRDQLLDQGRASYLAQIIAVAAEVEPTIISRGRFEQRIRELAAGNPMLVAATEPMLTARSALRRELAGLERHVRQLARKDPVCRRLMSMPGIGAVVALTYRSAIDDPGRFTSSKKVGP